MQRISSADLIRNFGRYSDVALSEPVLITKNGRERLVLLSAEEYNFLLQVLDAHEDAKEDRPDRRRAERPDAEEHRKTAKAARKAG